MLQIKFQAMFALLALAFVASGCWLFGPSIQPPAPHEDTFPDDIDALVAFADDTAQKDAPLAELEKSVAALKKAARLLGSKSSEYTAFDVNWRLARACFVTGERVKESAVKLGWVNMGEDAAATAARERPDRVEGHYYLALLKGRRAEHAGLGFAGMKLARDVEEEGLRAAELDETYDAAGPLRLLAMLYAKAPPWPTSIGDLDLALEYGGRAINISDYPLNHLFMAEVLIEADEPSEAHEELKKVLAAPKVGKWAREGERWRPYAMQLLRHVTE